MPTLVSSGSVLVRIRIGRRLHLDAQRGANQIEFLAEAPFQIPLIGICDMFQRITMDDDDGRVHSTLVGVAHFGAVHAGFLGVWNWMASSNRRVSTGVGILQLAAR